MERGPGRSHLFVPLTRENTGQHQFEARRGEPDEPAAARDLDREVEAVAPLLDAGLRQVVVDAEGA